MITIQYPVLTKEIEAWTEQLEEWVVAYKLEKVPHLQEVTLIEADTTIVGPEAIEQFLGHLKADIDDWRTPRCGV